MCSADDLKLLAPLISFAVIGTGFFTGANLLLRLLGYEPEKSHLLDIGALSVFIIDVVSEIDPAVGSFIGESYYMRGGALGLHNRRIYN
ncbi:MAG: hypothetical protein QW782_05595 [Candidatus Bathyarchaeia archaeon]